MITTSPSVKSNNETQSHPGAPGTGQMSNWAETEQTEMETEKEAGGDGGGGGWGYWGWGGAK